jgi:phenylalanyl-tRNA synthetase beta chain
MKVSINEMKRLGYEGILKLPVEELVTKIGAQLGGVEEVEDLGAKYKGAVVAKVVGCEKHPNADRLNVCKIDDDGKVEGVARDDNGYVQVVCGAPNVREGLFVVWLPPASTVPETYHHEEPFVLDARELRGVVSSGMLASAKELALGDSHDGILEIDVEAHPGQPFAEVYQLDDHIIDIENKMFTHRPDCFGLLGVAREIAGIQQQAFVSPTWYRDEPKEISGKGLKFDVHNDIKDLVPRFMAVALQNVTVSASPLWLQTALLRLGSRPINNVVDITNYMMLVTGQPLHAYDYDKLKHQALTVRTGKEGETVTLLNGKTISVTEGDIVIADGDVAIGLGGVMGGLDTEVTDATQRIVLESATFDMYAIRKTSMRHGLFTDAVTRFNKGQSPLQNDRVLARAVEMLQELSGAEPASDAKDSRHIQDDSSKVVTAASFINSRLGLSLSAIDMAHLLTNVEFKVEVNDDQLIVKAPFWRTDIDIPEDIVEEVGRLYGYDSLPRILPSRTLTPAAKNPEIELKRTVRRSLSGSGANELLTYSFVHEKLFSKAGQDKADAFQLGNALSPDLQYYRLSIIPSLLDKVHANIRAGHNEFAIFEIGKAHNARLHLDDDDGLPKEPGLIDCVYAATAKTAHSGAAFYHVKRVLDKLASDLGLEFEYAKHEGEEQNFPIVKPFDLRRSAYVSVKGTGEFLGLVGEFRSEVSRAFKLPKYSAGFTLGAEELLAASKQVTPSYTPLSRFPSVTQDLSLKTKANISYADVSEIVSTIVSQKSHEQHLATSVSALSIYQAEDDASFKTTTFRISVASYEKTLNDQDVSQILDAIVEQATQKIDAHRV